MITHRVLAVVAAVMLVAAVGIATFGSQSLSLEQALYLLDHDFLDRLPVWSSHTLGAWVWDAVLRPLLVRPAWLIPASIGLVCLGLSLSISNRKTTHSSRKRS